MDVEGMSAIVEVGAEIRITGADEALAGHIEESLTFDNPDFLSALKSGRGKPGKCGVEVWDSKTRCTISIPRHVCFYRKDGDVYVVPYGFLTELLKFDIIPYGMPCPKLIDEDLPSLYEYQKKAVETVLKRVTNPIMPTGGVLIAPCGSGKTRIGLTVASRINGRILWITHTLALLGQSETSYKALYGGGDDGIGRIAEGKADIGKRITFSTVQTLALIDLEKIKKKFDLIIVDECHHCVGSYAKATRFNKVLSSLESVKIGLTATPDRADGMTDSMYAILGPPLHVVDKRDLGDMYVPIKYEQVHLTPDIDLTACKDRKGTLSYSKLMNVLTEDVGRIESIIRVIEGAEKPVLVLGCRLNFLRTMAERTGGTMLEDDITSGADITFATYQLVAEGYDRPNLRTLILASPESDPARIVQSVGRVRRKSFGKTHGTVIDIVDFYDYAKHERDARKRKKLINSLN